MLTREEYHGSVWQKVFWSIFNILGEEVAGGGRACSVKWRCDVEGGGSGGLQDKEDNGKEEYSGCHWSHHCVFRSEIGDINHCMYCTKFDLCTMSKCSYYRTNLGGLQVIKWVEFYRWSVISPEASYHHILWTSITFERQRSIYCRWDSHQLAISSMRQSQNSMCTHSWLLDANAFSSGSDQHAE